MNPNQALSTALRQQGAPLRRALRTQLENKLQADLGCLRIHTGRDAAVAARLLHARAFTCGNHIFFGFGQYAPDTREGYWLLAH